MNAPASILPTPEQFAEHRFQPFTEPRSKPYQEGFLAGARRVAAGKRGEGPNPYTAGTAHADAWWAGADEGIARYQWIVRKHTHATHDDGDTAA